MNLHIFKIVMLSLFLVITTSAIAKSTTALDSLSIDTNPFYKYTLEDCDFCGCGSSGGGMGYGTVGNENFIGVRYIYQQYQSRDGIFNNSPWVEENFNTLQLWGKIPVTKKLSLTAILPYHFHNRNFADNTSQNIEGLGDLSILGFYSIITPVPDGLFKNQQSKYKHSLELGGGIKLPTGAYNRSNNEGSVNPSFQVGTGSFDYILAANYSVGYKNWGLGLMTNYTIKTENKEDYHFGDQFIYGLNVSKVYNTLKIDKIIPFIGLAGEVYSENKSYGLRVPDTEGSVLFGRVGTEVTLKKLSTGINVMLPVSQNLNAGKVEAKYRLGIHLNYTL
ncbi:transporter [Leeuwenhoekiella sp. W20_SRS_FM14]|uniref:transporter n=1 Tax=Leeuwenhoekiella sp. W20_SRS_FM14 TaxID=3240270 RepID=UPI003F973AB8